MPTCRTFRQSMGYRTPPPTFTLTRRCNDSACKAQTDTQTDTPPCAPWCTSQADGAQSPHGAQGTRLPHTDEVVHKVAWAGPHTYTRACADATTNITSSTNAGGNEITQCSITVPESLGMPVTGSPSMLKGYHNSLIDGSPSILVYRVNTPPLRRALHDRAN